MNLCTTNFLFDSKFALKVPFRFNNMYFFHYFGDTLVTEMCTVTYYYFYAIIFIIQRADYRIYKHKNDLN